MQTLSTAIEKHSKFNKNDLELFMSSLIISSHQVRLVMMEEMMEFPFDALLEWIINLWLPYRITIDNHAGAEAAVVQPSKSECYSFHSWGNSHQKQSFQRIFTKNSKLIHVNFTFILRSQSLQHSITGSLLYS